MGCFWLQYCSARIVSSVLPDPSCLLSAVGQKATPCELLQALAFEDFLPSSLSLMPGAAAGCFALVLSEL